MSFDQVVEAILDLELLDRPAGDSRKHSADALRHIRTAILRFFHEVFVNMADARSLHQFSGEGNRLYGPPGAPTPHPKDRWRNQESLFSHLCHEIELLVKSSKATAEKFEVMTCNASVSSVQKILPASGLEYHYIYVCSAILPCLLDYYLRHYVFTVRAGNSNSEDCARMALRVFSSVSSLLEAPGFLGQTDANLCSKLLGTLETLGVKVSTPHMLEFAVPEEVSSVQLLEASIRNSASPAAVSSRMSFAISYPQFVMDLQNTMSGGGGSRSGMRISKVLAENQDSLLAHVMHAVKCSTDEDEGFMDDTFCLNWLEAVRGAFYFTLSDAESTWQDFSQYRPPKAATKGSLYRVGRRFLEAGALRMSLVLMNHTRQDIVLSAISLASQILVACPEEAQASAASNLKQEGIDKILVSIQTRLRQFAESARQSHAFAKEKADVEGSAQGLENEVVLGSLDRTRLGACDLLEMLQRLCKGHEKLQTMMSRLSAHISDVLEDLERNIISAIMANDPVPVLIMVKSFEFFSAAIGGPNNRVRLDLTRTAVVQLINRLLAKVRLNETGADSLQQNFRAMLRASAMRLLSDLLQTPLEPLVSKRLIDTIDWNHLLLKSWPEAHEALTRTAETLQVTPETLLNGHQTPRDTHEYLYRLESQACEQTSSRVQETACARAADIAHEGLMLAKILATLEGEDAFSHYPNLQGRRILIRNLLDEGGDVASFYTQRIVSVEMIRKHVLQRLYFILPESAKSIGADALDAIDEHLFRDLPTDNERERQEALLERMTAAANRLRCQVELSASSNSWVLHHKGNITCATAGLAIAINLVFIILFEEHGSEAEICLPSGRFVDFGHLGLPFFWQSTWLLLLLAVFHVLFSGLRLYASLVEKFPLHIFQERQRVMLEREKAEHIGAEPTLMDHATMRAAAVHATVTDGLVIFNFVLFSSSTLVGSRIVCACVCMCVCVLVLTLVLVLLTAPCARSGRDWFTRHFCMLYLW